MASRSSVRFLYILWTCRACRYWDADCWFIFFCFFSVLSVFFWCVKCDLFLSWYIHRAAEVFARCLWCLSGLAQNGAQVLACHVHPEGSSKLVFLLLFFLCSHAWVAITLSVFQVCLCLVGNVLLGFTVKVEQFSLIQQMMWLGISALRGLTAVSIQHQSGTAIPWHLIPGILMGGSG